MSNLINCNIYNAKLITSNNISSYFFIDASIEIEIDDQYASLQTGELYHHNDYSLPSNKLTIYTDGETNVITKVNEYTLNELNDDFNIDDINKCLDSDYTKDELIEIYNELQDLFSRAQQYIDEAEVEAEQELKNDSCHYIYVSKHDLTRTPSHPMRFDTLEEAEEEIEKLELVGVHSYIISAEKGIDNRTEGFSNF